MLKPKEEQQPKKEEHLGIFWKNLDILGEGESSFKPSTSKKKKAQTKKRSIYKGKHIERKRAQT